MRLALIFAESAFHILAFRGTCCTALRLSALSCIVRSRNRNRSSNSLKHICKGKF